MALFKISKGTKSNLNNQTLTEGYCWFTPEDGKFYIDAFKNEVLTRIPLNAAMADSVTWTNVTGRPGDATSTKGGILTDAQAVKLAGIATGAEVNQNAFSNIKIGSTTVAADTKTDTVEFTGSNITISGDATNDKVTFSLTQANVTAALGYTPPTTNTTYDVATQSANGLMSSTDKTKLDGIATGAEVNQNAFSSVKVGNSTVAADAKTDTLELVGSNVTLTPDTTNDKITIGITSTNVTNALGYTPPQQDTTYSNATTSAAGLMSADDKTKLNGIATGAEVNQNAFGKVKVGSTTVEADAKIDTLELVGSNVTLTPDATNDKVTIGITNANVVAALGYTPPTTNTTYDNATTSAAGLMSSDDKTKLNGIATGAEVNQNAFSNIKVGSTTVAADAKTDTVEFVGSNVTITPDATNDKVTFSLTSSNVTTALGYTPPQQDTTYSAATQSAAGLMSAADKKKLDGVATGAQVNVLESVTASGTAPLTLTAGAISGKSIAISGSIADATTNAKGVVKIGDGITVTDGTISVTAANLGLSNAMHYIGTSATAVTDGGNENPTISGYSTKTAGDVIIYGDNEYVYTSNNKWELLGQDGSFKTVQTAVNSATDETTTATRFVHSITQDANGVITVKTRPLPTYNNYSLPTASTSTKGGIKVGTGLTMSGEIMNHSNSVTAQTTQALYPIKIDACGHISAYGTAITSLPASDVYAWAKAATKPTYTASEVGALPDTTIIPSKTSDLINDSEFITGMTILSYGNSTWADFIAAYNANKVVYCRASSNSNPASGSQTRLAFMAYANNATAPTNVEFQYYRSVSTHTESQQGDQVYVYKLDKSSGWSVTVREASVKVAYNNGITGTYSNGVMTLKHANTAITAQATQGLYPIAIDAYGHITGYGSEVTSLPASDVSAWAKASTKPSYALSEITGASDIQAIEALSGTSGILKKTAANTWTLDTTAYTTNTGTVTKVTAGTGLNTSADQADSATKGSITTTGTLYLTTSGVTAGSYGPSANATPAYGATFNVPYVTVDKYGRVTAASTKTVKIPASDNTDTKQNVTLATTSKAYLTGVTTTPTSSAQALAGVADTGVYLTTTAGQLNATSYKVAEAVSLVYDSTTQALNFVFA